MHCACTLQESVICWPQHHSVFTVSISCVVDMCALFCMPCAKLCALLPVHVSAILFCISKICLYNVCACVCVRFCVCVHACVHVYMYSVCMCINAL